MARDIIEMFKQEEKEIGGILFIVSPFSAIKAIRLQSKLLKLLLPALGGIVSGFSNNNSEKFDIMNTKINGKEISTAITELFQNLDEIEQEKLMIRIFENTKIKTEAGILDLVKNGTYNNDAINYAFTKNIQTLYKALWFVLEVNYSDFLSGLAGIGDKIKTGLSDSPIVKEKE